MSKTPPKVGIVQVDFNVPGRTVYNLSDTFTSDMQMGTITPIRFVPIISRDRHEINIRAAVNTFPAKAPITTPSLARIYAFWVPFRIYMPELRLNDSAAATVSGGYSPSFTEAEFPQAPWPGLAAHDFYKSAYAEGDFADFIAWIEDSIFYPKDALPDRSSPDFVRESYRQMNSSLFVNKYSLLEYIGMEQRTSVAEVAVSMAEIIGAQKSQSTYDPNIWSFTDWDSFSKNKYNAFRVLAYYDIFRNYFANPNEPYYPLYSPLKGDGSKLYPVYDPEQVDFVGFPFETLERYYNQQRYYRQSTAFEEAENFNSICQGLQGEPQTIGALPWRDMAGTGLFGCKYAGLATKCYQPDLNSTFIGSAQYQNVIAKSIVNVIGNQLNMSDLLIGQKVYDYFQKEAATGGRFPDFMRAEYGVDLRKYLDIPTFIRSWSFPIGFDSIVSTNTFEAEDSYGLGQLAGRGYGSLGYDPKDARSRKANQFAFSSDEPGELVFLMTIEPLPTYSTGIDFSLLNQRYDDYYTPSFDRIGMEPVFRSQVNSAITPGNIDQYFDDLISEQPTWFTDVLGYQPAWTSYKSEVPRVYGDMADNLAYWSFLRDTTAEYSRIGANGVYLGSGTGYTNYIIPEMYNTPFQDTSRTGAPFIVQVCFDHVVKRAMSARTMSSFNN